MRKTPTANTIGCVENGECTIGIVVIETAYEGIMSMLSIGREDSSIGRVDDIRTVPAGCRHATFGSIRAELAFNRFEGDELSKLQDKVQELSHEEFDRVVNVSFTYTRVCSH